MLVVDVGSFPGPGLTGFSPSIDNSAIAFLVQGDGIYLATPALTPTALPTATGSWRSVASVLLGRRVSMPASAAH
jgi:hypothetical protein